jgi:hypothetical protein
VRSIERTIPWLLPVLLSVIVIVVYLGAYKFLVLCHSRLIVCEPQHGITEAVSALLILPRSDPLLNQLDTLRLRLVWTVAVGGFVLVCVVAAVVGTSSLFYSSRQIKLAILRARGTGSAELADPRLPTLFGIVGILLPVGVPALFWLTQAGDAAQLWRQLLTEALTSTLPAAVRWTPALDMAGLGLGLLLAWAACGLLKSARVQENLHRLARDAQIKDPVVTPGVFHEHARLLKGLLYTGAALLVIAMLRVHALLDWELEFLRPTETQGLGATLFASLQAIVNTIITIQGLFYSLILAAFFVPAYLMLRTSGVYALSEVASDDREKELERWEGHFNILKLAPKLAAILAPLLSAPISQYLETLLG